MSAIIALTLYMGAISRIPFVSSLKSIDTDQMDACEALDYQVWLSRVCNSSLLEDRVADGIEK